MGRLSAHIRDFCVRSKLGAYYGEARPVLMGRLSGHIRKVRPVFIERGSAERLRLRKTEKEG